MIDREEIVKSLKKSCAFLVETQDKDGSWRIEEEGGAKYKLYTHPVILTSQAVKALVFNIDPSHIQSIRKALNFCYNAKVDESEDIDIHAWQLAALNFSDSKAYDKRKAELMKWIISQQTEEGYWSRFPTTNYLTNYAVLEALKYNRYSHETNKSIRRWIKNSRSRDGLGWSFDPSEDKSWMMATSDAIITAISAGEDPLSDELQDALKYIKTSQKPYGNWIGKFKSDHENSHATAAAALCVMLLSEKPFSKQVESAIRYLLDCQADEGYYLRKAIHPVRYVNQFLSFYLYLKDVWNSEEAHVLKGKLKPQHVTVFYWKQFNRQLRNKLKDAVYKSVVDSRILGTTLRAIQRREDIIKALDERGPLDVAQIIDVLKENEAYQHLKKKSHLTQIKSDVEFLKDLKVVQEGNHKYYLGFSVI